MSTAGEINEILTENLQKHHEETGRRGIGGFKIYGHRDFDVFLENGSQGEIEANSYYVVYKELEDEE
jgi:hypothetical protein